MNSRQKKEEAYRNNHVFHELRSNKKFLYYPENTQQLPSGYFIIITIDVGHHQTHKMWKRAFTNKASAASKPFHSVGAIKLVQGLPYWEKSGTN